MANFIQRIGTKLGLQFLNAPKASFKEMAKSDKKRLSYALQRQRIFLADTGQDELKAAIMMAEDPHNPRREYLYAFYKQTMRDLHIKSQIRTAINKVISEPGAIVNRNSKAINKDLTELLQKQWFEDTLRYYLETEFWSHSLIEYGVMEPDPETGKLIFKQVCLIPREHVRPETGELLIRPSDTTGFPYREAPYNKWLIEAGNPEDLGLLADLSANAIYKRFSKSDWSRSSEKWGDPLLVIKSSSDDDAENAKKEEFAANFGNNGYVIVDDDDEVDMLERSNSDGYNIYKEFCAYLDSENSKGINGQTATSDEKSFVGSAEVQERIMYDYTTERLRGLFYFVNDKVIPFLISVLDGNTAYGDLKGHAWIPLKFLPEANQGNKPKPEDEGGSPGKKSLSLVRLAKMHFETFHKKLENLYKGICGHDHPAIQLSSQEEDFDSIIERIAKSIHSGNDNPEELDQELYFATSNQMQSAFWTGYGKKGASITYDMEDNALINRVQSNLFAFSGAKSYSQMNELRNSVYDENGKLVPWTEFREKALKMNEKYNEFYLQVERDNVIRSGTLGSKWLDIQRDKDLYPYLEFVTEGDSKVRQEHAKLNKILLPVDDPFWDYNYPPLDWNCRCSVKQRGQSHLDGGKGKLADSETAQKAAGKARNKMFKGNVGKDGVVFTDKHAYFENMPSKQLKAANYGLRSTDKIYERPEKLPAKSSRITDIAGYDAWWKQMAKNNPSKTDGAFELRQPKLKTSLQFDSDLMVKLVEKERYKYADEMPNLVNNPDEIWSGYLTSKNVGGEYLTTYIKYYNDSPIVLVADDKGKVRSFYQLEERNTVGNFRKGLLLHRK